MPAPLATPIDQLRGELTSAEGSDGSPILVRNTVDLSRLRGTPVPSIPKEVLETLPETIQLSVLRL